MKSIKLRHLTLAIAATFSLVTTSANAAELTDAQKTLYALGQNISQSLAPFSLTTAELDFVKQGMTDGVAGKKSLTDANTYNPKIQALVQSRQAAIAAKSAGVGKAFLAKAAAEKGAVKTESGMVYIALTTGTGDSPAATDTVKVHYRGTSIDGKEFDSSYTRGQPAEFPLNGVIKCWTEGVQKMKVGGKARLVCPADLAYGERGSPPNIAPGATLNFEVELLGLTKK